jgi:hypothetical protein
MKTYFDNLTDSIAIDRVVTNLERYLPVGITRTANRKEADLVILHVYGRRDHILRDVKYILENGKQYAIVQYAIKSTRNPNPDDWRFIWDNAKAVWSYYDLPTLNLYCAPLAADPDIFYTQEGKKDYLVGTLGICYQAECFGEVHMAAFQARGRVVHVGPKFGANPNVDIISNIDDDELRGVYNGCNWFACLRRKEGFEVPAIEALLCGARPIMFESYRKWFDGLAEFIPEGTPGQVVQSLGRILKGPVKPVTSDEIEEVKKRFDWKRTIDGFWDRLLHG